MVSYEQWRWVLSVLVVLALESAGASDSDGSGEDIKFRYVYDSGKEALKLVGQEGEASPPEDPRCESGAAPPGQAEEDHQSIFESMGSYFIGDSFVDNVRQYYETIARSDEQHLISEADEELENIETELASAYTQLMILRRRQGDLAAYIEESLKKANEHRNPTVEELVLMEDDRLALLDQRLKRIISKLKKQKGELLKFKEQVLAE
eukprot:TRINITY_DN6243_c0_g1_i1.p1 TRINITY_DN6243_c0_g1~~TRINITY_DN6243_c0_g1_i1.p1  ORF type:complete len:207 (+),score=32.17 TRINITY_DN6243_c0_g1_i1:38-658(+)